jgi:hypothetical protein
VAEPKPEISATQEILRPLGFSGSRFNVQGLGENIALNPSQAGKPGSLRNFQTESQECGTPVKNAGVNLRKWHDATTFPAYAQS